MRLGAGVAQAVAQLHHALAFALDAVQQAVHQRQAAGAGDQLHADVGLAALEAAGLVVQRVQIIGVLLDVAVGGDQKAGGAGGRVLDDFAGLRLHAADDGSRSARAG